MRFILIFCALLASGTATADEAEDAFVRANLLGIFYHELGHAMIDIQGLPVFGQEEDAADVASILLIDELWEPDAALELAYDAAFGFAAEAMMSADSDEIPFWDVHGPDEQRFYNTVCIFYGGDPDARDDFASDMELPEERAESCEEEFQLAIDSWGPVLDEMTQSDGAKATFTAKAGQTETAQLIAEEVDALNDRMSWAEPLLVETDECGEANAFYDPERLSVTVCEEFAPHLRELYRDSQG